MVTPATGDGDALFGELAGASHRSYASTRRVFRIIDRVSTGGERLTVKALAHDLGISVSTCYHLVGILLDEGYIEKLPHHAGYRLGATVGVLFERSRRSGSAAVVEPVLHDLARLADRTAYYAVLSGTDDVVVTHVYSPPDCPPVGVSQGFTGPSHALALGKVLIAAGGSAAINRYIERHELRAFTRRTITDATKLEAHLKEVRTRGYATDFEEFANNLYCVAVPVSYESGTVAGAVGLATTATSPADELKRMIRLTRQAATQISTALRGESRTPAFEGLF
ncbi:MAG: IclR family transcriptional regulator [Solirubrobacterales bacterium]|nr:IclR family transcriptional regulator [Solirubrobacterales bacterium]MBV9714444.1 IclR family transcriptional regulator [Solirubrobacterales bacterium]